ncbi:MAG: EF-hand domain-containing protein [Planctomycetes bacterium]|nr:EF-hand domain-containing protein [Planctomycetota bacterium]
MSRLTNRLFLVGAFSVLALAVTVSFAQEDRGGRDGNRGGDRGGRGGGGFRGGPEGGGPGGGFPGGGGGFRGGPPGGGGPGRGGFRGGGPGGSGFSPADMLRRFDANGNGMLDPAESQGPASFFLQRIAGAVPGIDLAKPIPIEKLSQAIDRMRQQRESGGGDNNSGRGTSGSARTAVEPLVPGFGIEDLLPPATGFGAEAELLTVKATDADMREAEERFRRYDSNRDGILDKAELARGRWSDDPFVYDRNHDGKLTLPEMAVRYARRREADAANRSTQTAGNSNDPRSGRGGDRGGFGRGGFGGGGEEGRSFFSRRDSGGGGGGQQPTAASSSSTADSRKSYRVKTVTERLPKGLPDWFARDDANADGQVAMYEYAKSWSDSVLKEFGQFDLNHDSVITPSEALAAVNNGSVRGSAGASPSSTATTASSTTTSQTTPAATNAGPPPKIDPRYLSYYQKLLAKYDTNSDGALVANEWKNMSKDPTSADSNGDGRIVVNELAVWSMKR